jgi:hypothetical protein
MLPGEPGAAPGAPTAPRPAGPAGRAEAPLATPPTGGRRAAAALLDRWFVRYNPLFFASAMLVLAGAWQLAGALREMGLGGGPMARLMVLAIYAAVLAVAASWLWRRAGERRAAVLLALLVALVALDPTCALAAAAIELPAAQAGGAALAWAALVALLAWRLSGALGCAAGSRRWPNVLWPTAVAALVGGGPLLLDARLSRDSTYLALATAGLALALAMRRWPLALGTHEVSAPATPGETAGSPAAAGQESAAAADAAWEATVRKRLALALPVGWLVALAAHAGAWAVLFDVWPLPGLFLLVLATTVLAARSTPCVALAALLLVGCSWTRPELPAIAAAVALALLWRVWRGMARGLLAGAVVAGWVAATAALGGAGRSPLAAFVALGLLVALTRRERSPWPWLAGAVVVAATDWRSLAGAAGGVAAHWLALPAILRAAVLLFGGFASLGLGIWLSLRWGTRGRRPR